jgi:demethylmenaquinone methyltransferase / 2-methoxy-6-polyprenyl-1,4-benzoquinol methylase
MVLYLVWSRSSNALLMQKHYVGSLFDAIAHRYDLLNHLLSGGIDLYWRRRAIQHLADIKPKRILDVATGTADFAIAALQLHPVEVVGVDIADEMLKRGREKVEKRGLQHLITLQHGEAEDLRFDAGMFDAAIVAFGARNFEDLPAGLAEMCRVLRPGGKVIILEFSRPSRFPFRQGYFFYFRNVLPLIGRLVSRHEYAYQYLPDTVMKFPQGEDFLAILRRVGFASVAEERLTFGIATIYSGVKGSSTNVPPAVAGPATFQSV